MERLNLLCHRMCTYLQAYVDGMRASLYMHLQLDMPVCGLEIMLYNERMSN